MGLEETKTICVVGGYFEDIVLYLMRILQCCGHRVVISDHTVGHRFYPSVPHIESLEPIDHVIDYRGVEYIFGNSMNGETKDLEKADIRILLYDISGFVPGDTPAVLITDESKRNLDLFDTMDVSCRNLMIVRFFTGVNQKRIKNLAERFKSENVFALSVDQADYKLALIAESSDMYRFTGISKELSGILKELTVFILPDIEERIFKKAYKKAAKGGIG